MSQASLLIVDDEAGVRESLRVAFDRDFRILEADSREVAIQKVKEERPQIILLDIRMPRASGLEVLKQIKEVHRDCQVIMVTALVTDQMRANAKEQGAFDYVVKPFDVEDLRLKVKLALAKVAEQAGGQGK
ncbi:MAG: response regulator [Candidatus Binatia bacterium]